MLFENLLVLALAFGVDFVFGEPRDSLHPTVWMGKVAQFIYCRFKIENPIREKIEGCFLAVAVILPFSVASYLILTILRFNLGSVAYVIAGALIFKTTFAIRSMQQFTFPIVPALEEGSIGRARMLVQKVVRRDASELDEQHVISAAVETIAEGTVDGIASPIFYFGLLGVPGAVAYRAVNTLDSTVGYKDRKYVNVGWLSAKLDTIANFIPARLVAILIIVAAFILGEDWKNAWRVLSRDHGRTESVNAGWPMSAMAGTLNVRLEKPGHYILGDANEPLTPKHIAKALRIMYVSTLLLTILVAVALIAVVSMVK